MEVEFEPGELDHLVNEILSQSLSSDSESLPSSSLNEEPFSVFVNNVSLQDPDLDTIDIQDLVGEVSFEELFVANDLSESSHGSLPCSQGTPGRSRETSQSGDGKSDVSETPWSPVSGSSSSESTPFVCPVCGNPSGKHFYYGAQVCSSCRAFFRRATVNSAARSFSCQGQQKCGIDSKSWKSCKFCRFQKCLSAGMKPTWVMNDEERSARNSKRKRLRNKRDVNHLAPEVVLGNQWTVDEEKQIQGIREDILSKSAIVYAEFYSSNPAILQNVIECAKRRKPFDPLVITHIHRYVANQMMRIFSDLLILKEINSLDRFLLLSRNFSAWSSFQEAILFQNHQEVEKNQHNMQNCIRQIKTSNASTTVDLDIILENMDHLSLEDNVESSVVLNNCIQDPPTRERRKKLLMSIQSWPKFGSQRSSDDTLTTLMMMILISCPDSLQLQSKDIVSQMQTQYCYILYRYIKSIYPVQAHSKLGEGMDLITKVREVARMGEAVMTQTICNL